MCNKGTVVGADVKLDTSEARRTVNAQLPVCRCLATVRNAGFIDVTITGPADMCGSFLKLSPVETVTSGETCDLTEKKKVKVNADAPWNITLEKLHEPFHADYCVSMKIGKLLQVNSCILNILSRKKLTLLNLKVILTCILSKV